MDNNNVRINGQIISGYELDHETFNEKYYQFLLLVKRKSNVDDIIPVVVSERLLNASNDDVGKYVDIVGEYRSFNVRNAYTGKTKVILYVFPISIDFVPEPTYENDIELTGTICKKPNLRQTLLGRTVSDITLAVNRRYGKTDYIPCIVWNRNAQFVSHMNASDKIKLIGRIQSREYNKNNQIHTAYEVSGNILEVVN